MLGEHTVLSMLMLLPFPGRRLRAPSWDLLTVLESEVPSKPLDSTDFRFLKQKIVH